VAYFVRLADGGLDELTLVPFRSRQLSLRRATSTDAHWLLDTLNRECRPFGAQLTPAPMAVCAWRRRLRSPVSRRERDWS